MTRNLILVALIALLVCTGFGFEASCTEPPEEWRLTISSTEGGTVTMPGEGVFWYAAHVAVELVAEPDEGYQFVGWTGRVDTLWHPSQLRAEIYVNYDCTITANFAPLEAGE